MPVIGYFSFMIILDFVKHAFIFLSFFIFRSSFISLFLFSSHIKYFFHSFSLSFFFFQFINFFFFFRCFSLFFSLCLLLPSFLFLVSFLKLHFFKFNFRPFYSSISTCFIHLSYFISIFPSASMWLPFFTFFLSLRICPSPSPLFLSFSRFPSLLIYISFFSDFFSSFFRLSFVSPSLYFSLFLFSFLYFYIFL